MLDAYVEDAGKAADLILKSMNSAAELVRSFKQVSADQTSEQRRVFDLAAVIKEVLVTLGPTLKKTAHCVETELDETITLNSFPGPIGRVLVNLISNALVHAYPEGESGTIRISIRSEGSDACLIMVSDDGKGIPPEHLKRIFEPFFTTRLGQGGSGLGLSIVYNNVVGLLGGTIVVKSELGKGTEFVIHLPLDAPNVNRAYVAEAFSGKR
jgi:signal transduction histidine kinase